MIDYHISTLIVDIYSDTQMNSGAISQTIGQQKEL